MHNFEIRFAQTGHFQIYDKVASIQMLQQKIFKQYKIQINNQRLFTKKGCLVGSGNRLDQYSESALKKTYSNDHNNSNNMKEGMYLFNHKQMLKTHPEQKTEKQFIQQQGKIILYKRRQYCQGLRQNIYQLEPLAKKFSNEQAIQILAYKPQLKDMANYWLASTLTVRDHMCTFKQIEEILDNYVSFWENQRKALMILIKNLQIVCFEKNSNITKCKQNVQCLEKMFRQLNDGCQQSLNMSLQASIRNQIPKNRQNYIYQSKSLLGQSIQSLRKKLSSIQIEYKTCMYKSTQFKRNIKQKYKALQKPLKQLDALKKKKLIEIQSYFGSMKDNYINLIQAISCRVENKSDDSKIYMILNQRKAIQAKYEQYKRKGQEYTIQMENYFVDLYTSYMQNEQMVKSQYKKYYSIYIQIQQHLRQNCQKIKQQILSSYKSISDLKQYLAQSSHSGSLSQSLVMSIQQKSIKKSPQKPSSTPNISPNPIPAKIKQLQQKQIRRRMHFNNKLQNIHDQIKQILRQEQQARKTYLSQMLSIQQMYDNQILGNVRVPCIMINFDQTSDIDMLTKYKIYNNSMYSSVIVGSSNSLNNKENTKQNNQLLSNLSLNIQLYKQSGMDRVLKQLQFIKSLHYNLKNQSPQNQSKVKNLQLLLQKSSDIFHHIYNYKLNMMAKTTQSQLQSYINQITVLERQKKELYEQGYIFSQNFSLERQNKKQLEDNLSALKDQLTILKAQKLEIEKQLNKVYEDNMSKIRAYQATIQDNKKQISRLKQQKRQIEQKITQQVGNTMQTLLSELQKSQNTIKQLSQINHEYKIVMGDQAIRIETLQAQLKVYKQQNIQLSKQISKQQGQSKQVNKLKQCFYGENLKQIIQDVKNNQNSQNNQRLIEQNGQYQHNIPSQLPLIKRQSKSITNEQIKQIQRQITKLQKKIEELKQQNQELKNENNNLNDQIMKIALKDTEDVEMQTEESQNKIQAGIFGEHKQSIMVMAPQINHLDFIKIDNSPQVGQLRLFIPFSPGIYVALKSSRMPQQPIAPTSLNFLTSQTRNYLQLHQTELQQQQQLQQTHYPYIIDMNCLASKARELLMQCSLVVALRVTKILPAADRFYVQGTIRSALGFQDEEIVVKDYGGFL